MSTAKIVYSINGEHFAFDTVTDVFDALDLDGELKAGQEYYSAEAVIEKPSDFFDVGSLLDDIHARAWDDGGEWADDFVSQLTPAQREELKQLVSDWLDKNMTVNFRSVKNIRTLTVTAEDLSERQQWKR